MNRCDLVFEYEKKMQNSQQVPFKEKLNCGSIMLGALYVLYVFYYNAL